MTVEQQMVEKLVQQYAPGSKLRRWWPVTGGVSAQVIGLELAYTNGMRETAIMRRHGEADLASNPNIAADEFRLLNLLHPYNLGTAKPLFLDTSCEIFPTPLLLLEYLEGETIYQPQNIPDFVQPLATKLAQIHRIDGTNADLSFLPLQVESDTHMIQHPAQTPDESMFEDKIRAVLLEHWPPAAMNPSVLLHGDYWPGNVLWREGQLVGVIDWENAAVGDPLSDLSRCRMELMWSLGVDAMQDFTRTYQALAPSLDYQHLPLYDLCAALRPIRRIAHWGLDEATENRIRQRHRAFIQQALNTEMRQ